MANAFGSAPAVRPHKSRFSVGSTISVGWMVGCECTLSIVALLEPVQSARTPSAQLPKRFRLHSTQSCTALASSTVVAIVSHAVYSCITCVVITCASVENQRQLALRNSDTVPHRQLNRPSLGGVGRSISLLPPDVCFSATRTHFVFTSESSRWDLFQPTTHS